MMNVILTGLSIIVCIRIIVSVKAFGGWLLIKPGFILCYMVFIVFDRHTHVYLLFTNLKKLIFKDYVSTSNFSKLKQIFSY